jgi:hypothetical protein
MGMMFLLLACSSVLLDDSDVPPCVAACDVLYGPCRDAGVAYADDHADCVGQCAIREEGRPGESGPWGECVLASDDLTYDGCMETIAECGHGACYDPSSDRGDGGCGHY